MSRYLSIKKKENWVIYEKGIYYRRYELVSGGCESM